MTDTLPAIAITPEQAQAMPEATRTAAREQYARAGYSTEQIAAAFGPAMPAAPAKPQATAIQLPGSDVRIAPGPSDGLSADQRLAGYKAVLRVTSDPEAVIAAAERDGISRAQLTAEPADPAAVTAAAREAMLSEAFASTDAASYSLTWPRDFAEATDIQQLSAFDTDTRHAFATARVPASMAQGLLEAIIDTGAIYEKMSDTARQLRFKEEGAMFKKLSADPDNDARLASLAYSRLPASYRKLLDENYRLHSARAQLMLAGIGRAIEYREAKKK